MMDKEHFNTLQLLKKNQRKFYNQGHNRIYQYFLTLAVIVLSFKIFFYYSSKKNVIKYYSILFFSLLIIQVINSYLIFLLNNNEKFELYYYYFINFFILSLFSYIILRFDENN